MDTSLLGEGEDTAMLHTQGMAVRRWGYMNLLPVGLCCLSGLQPLLTQGEGVDGHFLQTWTCQ